jgi:hypothetical protein
MALQEGEFREQGLLTKRGRPTIKGRSPRDQRVVPWTAIAGIGFMAIGVFYLSLDLPAATSWAPLGCIIGGAAVTKAAMRSKAG